LYSGGALFLIGKQHIGGWDGPGGGGKKKGLVSLSAPSRSEERWFEDCTAGKSIEKKGKGGKAIVYADALKQAVELSVSFGGR